MSASPISQEKKQLRRTSLKYICAALFCGLFSAVYEQFSHGVYSNFMIYLFAIPLFGGALPYAVLGLLTKAECPSPTLTRIYNSGLAALTVGSCVKGVLDIYGTTSSYMPIYWGTGIILTAIALAVYLIKVLFSHGRKAEA